MKTHLTFPERERIEWLYRVKTSVRDIGKMIGRDHSVISRELRRNKVGQAPYTANKAKEVEEKRRTKRKGMKLEKNIPLHDYVLRELRRGMSPDVISGCMKTMPIEELRGKTISHESIYHYIYEGEGRNEGLYHLLLHHRRRRQKHGTRKSSKKSRILERLSINARPEEVASRTTFGHWESDTVIYSKQRAVLSVQVERASRLLRFHRAPNKTAEETEHALRKTIESLPEQGAFKTMTFDNGTEGARHTVIRDEYDIATYFCDTYASWQKGTVENMNRIIRRFLPKTKDLSVLSDREIYEIQERINDMPRKILGYRTANEVAKQYLREVVHC